MWVITDHLPTFMKNVNFINKCEDDWLCTANSVCWEHLWSRWWKICLRNFKASDPPLSYRWRHLTHNSSENWKILVLNLNFIYPCNRFGSDIWMWHNLGKTWQGPELFNTPSCCSFWTTTCKVRTTETRQHTTISVKPNWEKKIDPIDWEETLHDPGLISK